MEGILSQLVRVNGVKGAAIFDLAGATRETAGAVDSRVLRETASIFNKVVERAIAADNSKLPTNLCIRFAHGCAFVEQHRDTILVVIADGSTNSHMLNAARSFVGDELRRASAQAINAGRTYAGPVSSPGGLAVPNTVGLSVVQHIAMTFERYLGPRSRFILEEELQRLGVSERSLRFEQVGDLLIALSKRIPEAGRRPRFITEALGDEQ
jgi:hypothetical protein